MNLREGRIGRQEAAALALAGCTVGGLFAHDPEETYASGNSAYLSSLLSAALALVLFFLITEAMNRKNCRNLSELYRFAFGRFFGPLMALATFISLLVSVAAPAMRLLDILSRFVYPEAEPERLLLYMLPCILFLSWKGLETIGRTTRLLFPLVLISVLGALLIAAPAYDATRLYPLLGNGLLPALTQGAVRCGRFFSPLLCLLICGVGIQGTGNAARSACIGALLGGLVTGGTQLCLGMTYPYELLRELRAPMYRLTMSVRTGSAYVRMDKLLLFIWNLGGILISGFFMYAAALLYTSVSRMRDVRPAVAAGVVCLCSMALISQLAPDLTERVTDLIYRFLPLLLLLPPMLASALACLKKGVAE